MTKQQEQLREFHEKFGCVINDRPTIVDLDIAVLRESLIEEELNEFSAAAIDNDSRDLSEIADALGDLLYVVLGSAVSFGIDLEPVFEEIHRSNMSKVWPDGTIHKNELGKVIKPDTYSPADLGPIIEKQLKS